MIAKDSGFCSDRILNIYLGFWFQVRQKSEINVNLGSLLIFTYRLTSSIPIGYVDKIIITRKIIFSYSRKQNMIILSMLSLRLIFSTKMYKTKQCCWRWMRERVSRSISPKWNHKAAMHGPWEAPRCSAGIAINQPSTPSKDIKTTTSHHYHHQTTFKKCAWQHTSQQHPNT